MSEKIELSLNAAPREPRPGASAGDAAVSPFELAGGEATFFRLVERFYQGVAADPVLRPLYPADLSESIRHTALFLIQYCGGPGTYSQQRGHPRLRMRHAPFAIGQRERDAWVRHMSAAVEAEIGNLALRQYLLDYFERTATHMMNR